MKPKIMLVFGTRPEAIKMAPLCHAFYKQSEIFDTFVCVTAQHREMLDQVLNLFEITPDFDLDLMSPGQDLFDITSNVLLGMRDILEEVKPDLVLVHGDTSTTFATSLAAFYAGVRVGHVEAGLRTYDLFGPFPEEFNRQVTGKLADWHFCPTTLSAQNLIDEGVPCKKVSVTGNTVIDALYWVINRFDSDFSFKSKTVRHLIKCLSFNWEVDQFILITGHRRENFGVGFISICEAIRDLAELFPGIQFVYPVHLNPNVQQPVMSIVGNLRNVHLIAPLSYEPFIYLLNKCHLVLTDSGGIQEEAPSLGKPVIVMRDTTERPEAVSSGNVILVGASKEKIIANVTTLLTDQDSYQKMANALNPYGDGNSSEYIVDIIKESFNNER